MCGWTSGLLLIYLADLTKTWNLRRSITAIQVIHVTAARKKWLDIMQSYLTEKKTCGTTVRKADR